MYMCAQYTYMCKHVTIAIKEETRNMGVRHDADVMLIYEITRKENMKTQCVSQQFSFLSFSYHMMASETGS